MGERRALLIGNGRFDDATISPLKTPASNVIDLNRALQQSGRFTVLPPKVDASSQEVRIAIAEFFSDSAPDDLLLLFFSGHGMKDEYNSQLYLITCDTRNDVNRRDATAVSATFITNQIDRCRARNVIVVLDCCYSAAFTQGSMSAATTSLDAEPYFRGNGRRRVILTASDSFETAFEPAPLPPGVRNSYFSGAMIESISPPFLADTDGDGKLTIGEIFKFVQQRMVELGVRQTPQRLLGLSDEELALAFSPYPTQLPTRLRQLLAGDHPYERQGAIEGLKNLLHGPLHEQALAELQRLTSDRDDKVKCDARAALAAVAASGSVETAAAPDELPADPLNVFVIAPPDVHAEVALLREQFAEIVIAGRAASVALSYQHWTDPPGVLLQLPPDGSLGGARPAEADLVIIILWADLDLLSTPETIHYHGTPVISASEWLFLDAISGFSTGKHPQLVVFRCGRQPFKLGDPHLQDKITRFTYLNQLYERILAFSNSLSNPINAIEYNKPDDFSLAAGEVLPELLAELGRRTAAAATVAAEPATDASPPAPTDEVLTTYLGWMLDVHGRLEVRGLGGSVQMPSVPLEKVYVALKGVRVSATEREKSAWLFRADLLDLLADAAETDETFTPYDLEALLEKLRRQNVVENDRMPALRERDLLETDLSSKIPAISFGTAVHEERWMVVLGEPGSGKTTIARWLALQLAQAMRNEQPRVAVPVYYVDPEITVNDGTLIDLGPARLPILLRVSDYANARLKDPALTLSDYLGYHPWMGLQAPRSGVQLNALMKQYLSLGQALVILDGMDEITSASQRDDVVRAIEHFVRVWINDRGQLAQHPHRQWEYLYGNMPVSAGGNQMIITSRIAGYQAAPISGDFAHVTIQRMSRKAIEHFCDAWMRTIYDPDSSGRADQVAQAQYEATGLKLAIFNPENQRVLQLATNPLLVTILALVYQKNKGALPQQRVELYQTALEILVESWRATGLTTLELIYVLSPLAERIHQKYNNGLIDEDELREVITEHLATFRSLDPARLPPSFSLDVDRFLRMVREEVGLLSERSPHVYGFLHLTFQEYLAALYLVRDKRRAGGEIVRRLEDARWREPILMALGHVTVSQQWGPQARETLLTALLNADDSLDDLVPRSALLIITAIPEMARVPQPIMRQVTQRLLVTYADREGLGQFAQLRQQIEVAFTRLSQSEHRPLVTEVLNEALRDPQLAVAAATIIRAGQWSTTETIKLLIEALAFDAPAWGWPINAALREVLTFTPSNDLEAPQLPAQLKKVQQRVADLHTRIAQIERGERQAELREQIATLEQKFDELLLQYLEQRANFERRHLAPLYDELSKLMAGREQAQLESELALLEAEPEATLARYNQTEQEAYARTYAGWQQRIEEYQRQQEEMRRQEALTGVKRPSPPPPPPLPPPRPLDVDQLRSKLAAQLLPLKDGSRRAYLTAAIAELHRRLDGQPADPAVAVPTLILPPAPPALALERLRAELGSIERGEQRAMLDQAIDAQLAPVAPEWHAYQAAQQAYQQRRAALEQAHRERIPVNRLRFREALELTPDLVTTIKADPLWLRLVICIYGGIPDYDAAAVIREYDETATFLRQDEFVRDFYINSDFYQARWGAQRWGGEQASDTISNIEVYLDTVMSRRLSQIRSAVLFDAQYIYRDSPLTQRLLSALRRKQSPQTLLHTLWQAWRNGNPPALRVDALLALTALGAAVVPEIETALLNTQQRNLALAYLNRLQYLKHILGNAVVCLDVANDKRREAVAKDLQALRERLPDDQWTLLARLVVRTLVSPGHRPVDVHKLFNTVDNPYLHAEAWAYWMADVGENPIYDFAVVLDTIGKKLTAATAVAYAHRSHNLKWPHHPGWNIEPIPPRHSDAAELIGELLTVARATPLLHLSNNNLGLEALLGFSGYNLKTLPESYNELIALILTLPYTTQQELLESQAAEWAQIDPYRRLARLRGVVHALSNPAIRSRTFWRLATYSPGWDAEALLLTALEAAGQISEPLPRSRAYERLIPYLAEQRSAALAAALTAARAIPDPLNKARALARLSIFAERSAMEAHLSEALETVAQIAAPGDLVETVQLLQPFIYSYPELSKQARSLIDRIDQPWHRLDGQGLLSTELLQLHPTFSQTDAWTPLVLLAHVDDLSAYFGDERGLSSLWALLANQQGNSDACHELVRRGFEAGLVFTHEAAVALHQTLAHGDLSSALTLLPLLHSPERAAIAFIEAWQQHEDQMVADVAGLFLAELGRLNLATTSSLLRLLEHGDDRLRLRARLVLHGPIIDAKNQRRTLRASLLGEDVCLLLATALQQYNETLLRVAQVLSWTLLHNLIHDDPALITTCVALIERDDSRAEAARLLLSKIALVSDEVLHVLLDSLASSHLQVRKALLCSLFALGHTSEKRVEVWQHPQVRTVLASLTAHEQRTLRLLPDRFKTVVPVLKAALDQLQAGALAEPDRARAVDRLLSAQTLPLDQAQPQTHGGDLLFNIPKDVQLAQAAANIIGENPAMQELLLHWLAYLLRENLNDDDLVHRRGLLLYIAGIAAPLMGTIFAAVAETLDLEPLLLEAALHHQTFSGREGAVRLLGYLRRFNHELAPVLAHALRDVDEVQHGAFETARQLRQIDNQLLPHLFSDLFSPSTAQAYAAVQTLVACGRNEKLKPEQRQQIISAIAAAIRDVQSTRGIYILAMGKGSAYNISCVSRLDHVFYQALFDLAGVV